MIPLLKPLADDGWAVGLASSFILYTLLTRLFPARRRTLAPSPAESAPA